MLFALSIAFDKNSLDNVSFRRKEKKHEKRTHKIENKQWESVSIVLRNF